MSMYICGNNFQFAGTTTTSSDPVLSKHNISVSDSEEGRSGGEMELWKLDKWKVFNEAGYEDKPVTFIIHPPLTVPDDIQ